MISPRVIPVLLLHEGSLVKSNGFSNYKYIGDPLNAVKIFNDMGADELMMVDIGATCSQTDPNYNLIARIAKECRMPLCIGGGIAKLEQAKRIIDLGVEKVSIGAAAMENHDLIPELSNVLGQQSVVCVLDIKKSGLSDSKYLITTRNGKVVHKNDLVSVVHELQSRGVGEIVFNSVDRDGTMEGYDLHFVDFIKGLSKVPFTFLGGASSYSDFTRLAEKTGIVGCAAGSLFVFKGRYRSVFISYPSLIEKRALFLNITTKVR